MSKTLKTAKVWFGNTLFIEGILLSTDSKGKPNFGVALPQVYKQFDLKQKHANREVLWLMATKVKGLTVPQTKDKISMKELRSMALTVPQAVKTEVNDRAVNVLTLDEYDGLTEELAFDGNTEARNFMRLLRQLSLTQLFYDAFDLKFEKQERQLWLQERMAGKVYRRSLTDAIQARKLVGDKIDYSWVTMAIYRVTKLSDDYLEYKEANPKSHKFRDTLTSDQLRRVMKAEELSADYMLIDNMHYKKAIEKAARYIR